MEEIRISPTIQRLTLLALLVALAAAVAAQMPEIRRYMKIDSM
jgi:hypothetical protein